MNPLVEVLMTAFHPARTYAYTPKFGTPVQKNALAVGAVFLPVGVLGFVPGITTNYDQLTFAGHHSVAALLGIFNVSVLHNLVHLAFGVAGIALARKTILIWASSELNLTRMRGGLRPTSRRNRDSARHPLLDTQRPRIPAQPSCNVDGPSRANGGSSPVMTNGRPSRSLSSVIRPAQNGASASRGRQLLDPVRVRTLGVGVGAPCLSIVEL